MADGDIKFRDTLAPHSIRKDYQRITRVIQRVASSGCHVALKRIAGIDQIILRFQAFITLREAQALAAAPIDESCPTFVEVLQSILSRLNQVDARNELIREASFFAADPYNMTNVETVPADVSVKIDSLLAEIQELAGQTDPKNRRALADKLHSVSRKIEGPRNYIHRICFGQVELPSVLIGADISLYKHLTNSEQPASLTTLADQTGCNLSVLGRLCRYLASIDVISEASKDHFTANELTKELTIDGYDGWLKYSHDAVGPVMFDLAKYLRETKHADIESASNCPFQITHHTKLELFPWMEKVRPDILEAFNQCMKMFYSGMPTWLDTYPFREAAENLAEGQDFWVDIAGGIGHQCISLLKEMPDLKGKVVLEELAAVIDQAGPLDGVRKVAYNFFEEQKVTGARLYYFKHIIHDWPDAQAVQILTNTAKAMGKDSRMLIDEIVIPDTGAHWSSTGLDMTLLATFGSRERTMDQWLDILTRAGLRLSKLIPYDEDSGHHILECQRLDA